MGAISQFYISKMGTVPNIYIPIISPGNSVVRVLSFYWRRNSVVMGSTPIRGDAFSGPAMSFVNLSERAYS